MLMLIATSNLNLGTTYTENKQIFSHHHHKKAAFSVTAVNSPIMTMIMIPDVTLPAAQAELR